MSRRVRTSAQGLFLASSTLRRTLVLLSRLLHGECSRSLVDASRGVVSEPGPSSNGCHCPPALESRRLECGGSPAAVRLRTVGSPRRRVRIDCCVCGAHLFREGFFVGFRPASCSPGLLRDGGNSQTVMASGEVSPAQRRTVRPGWSGVDMGDATTPPDVLRPRRTDDADRERAGPTGAGGVDSPTSPRTHWSSPRRRCGRVATGALVRLGPRT